MNDLKYAEILAANRALTGRLQGPVYRIAVLSNIVISQVKDILEYALRSRGVNAEVVIGNFDNIVQDSAELTQLSAAVVFWEPANLVDGLQSDIESKSDEEVEDLARKTEREIELVAANLSKVPLVLFNRFSALAFARHCLTPNAFQRLCRRLNTSLEQAVRAGQMIVDIDAVLADVGLSLAIDHRQFLSSKALYGISFLKAYCAHVVPAFQALNGRARKVLALDCDNTLWGGILGEDGPDGIRLDNHSPEGRCYREVQSILKGFRYQGVLLALCTKNNPQDVAEVLQRHPDMVLRSDDFAAQAVNWENKASNLRSLARDLNVGLDSFVFLDDSDFELGLIAKELPQVLGVAVPRNPSEYPSVLRKLAREFFMPGSSAENERRTEMYREESARRSEAQNHASLADYLASLQLEVSVAWDEQVAIQRAAQMSQKTNQFNLTTRRYTDGDISRMVSDPTWSVATLSVCDRYGNYGVTGLVLLNRIAKGSMAIDTFLLSCRILGRNIELAFFDYLVGHLRDRGIDQLYGEYRRTSKNEQVAEFYNRLGFQTASSGSDGTCHVLELSRYQASGIEYIKVRESD